MSKKKIVSLGGMLFDMEFVEKMKWELNITAQMVKAGLEDEVSPCRQFVFELLKKEGLIETPVDSEQDSE